jgi:predicted acyltransferase (DUF342 family)
MSKLITKTELKSNIIIENESKLKTQVDKSNIILFEKESIIEDL